MVAALLRVRVATNTVIGPGTAKTIGAMKTVANAPFVQPVDLHADTVDPRDAVNV
jgi:hypothetical protein